MGDVEAIKEQIMLAQGQLNEGNEALDGVVHHNMAVAEAARGIAGLLQEIVDQTGRSGVILDLRALQMACHDTESAYADVARYTDNMAPGSSSPALLNAREKAIAARNDMGGGHGFAAGTTHASDLVINMLRIYEVMAKSVAQTQDAVQRLLFLSGLMDKLTNDVRTHSAEAGLSLNGFYNQVVGQTPDTPED